MVLALALFTNLLLVTAALARPFQGGRLAPRGSGERVARPRQSIERSEVLMSRDDGGDDDTIYAAGGYLNVRAYFPDGLPHSGM
jgi:hypothetical protein